MSECWTCDELRAKVARLAESGLSECRRANAAEAEVERLHNEIARPKYETLRQLADAVERNEQLKAEVARLRGLILNGTLGDWEDEANRIRALAPEEKP